MVGELINVIPNSTKEPLVCQAKDSCENSVKYNRVRPVMLPR